MKIGYNKAIGILMFIPSFVSCCLVVVMTQTDQSVPPTAVGLFWAGIALGALYLTRPYFEVSQNEFVIKALVGPVAKRIPFALPKDLSVEGRNIYIMQGTTRQKVNVAHWLADRNGWNILVQWIEKAKS